MKQFLSLALMAIILVGCSNNSEDKLSPGAKLMCDFYDDMAKQIADANSFDDIDKVFYNDSNFNRRKDIDAKLLEYKDDPYTAADKTSLKKSLKNLVDTFFSAFIRIGKVEEPERYNESEILELKQKQNEANSGISSTIDKVKTFGDLKLLFFIPFAYRNEK